MALNSKQKRAAEILVAEPERQLGDIAQELGVAESTFWRWRQTEEFKEYEHELCMERFRDLEKIAIQKLKENAKNNNQKAIEYILDYIGYKASEKLDVRSGDITINIVGDDE